MKNTRFLVYLCVFGLLVVSTLNSYANSIRLKVVENLTNKPIEDAQITLPSGDLLFITDKYGGVVMDTTFVKITVAHPDFIAKEIELTTDGEYIIKLQSNYSKETIPVLYDKKSREFTTSSISVLSGSSVENVVATNRLNTLSGRLGGIGVIQNNGLVGMENSNFQIRGQHTIGNRPGVTILVDGRETDYRMLDPYDIESYVVLKDAAATSIYGLLGGNGILLINTKRGKEGRVKVNYNGQFSIQEPLKLPKYLDSYHYAILYNEAMMNDNPIGKPFYSQDALNGYLHGKSPYAYPNVDWTDLFLKDYTSQTRHNINISGGSKVAKYYVSLGYLGGGGAFNTHNKVNTYNTNYDIDAFNVHGNVEVNINRNFYVAADIKAKRDTRTVPGNYSDTFDENILSTLYSTPFNAFQPISYLGTLGGWSNGANPYGMLNYSGYSNYQTNSISTTIDMKYDLSDFVKGLSIFGYFGVNSTSDYIINRSKSFASYIFNYDYNLNSSATFWHKNGDDQSITGSGKYSSIARKFDHLLGIKYEKSINRNTFDASVMIDRQQQKEHLYSSIGKTFQGVKAKASYRYDNRYLVDFAASYHGSNYFPPDKRYGFFPAISVGWVISNESFVNKQTFDLMKLRLSYGKTGNDIGSAFATYYGYMPNFSTGSGAIIGSSLNGASGMYQSRVGNPNITWETGEVLNLGIDFSLFKGKINGSIDYFDKETENILLKNTVSVMHGAEVWMPEGLMTNKGAELELRWNDSHRDLSWSLGGTLSLASNKIKNKNEEPRAYKWMEETGHPYGTLFGYIFDRFFVESDDFENLPDQSLLGDVKPGDLKYKDLNNDGVIDEFDRTIIGKSSTPELYYGIDLNISYKAFDLYALFQGIGEASYYKSGYTYWAFNSQKGNVMEHHLDRWTPGSEQNASYPRLSLTSTNNTQTSSFWVGNRQFVRLKQLEIGYTLPHSITRKIHISNLRLYLSGNNLLTWDKFKHTDPESSAISYPNVRTFTCGLNVSF